MDIDFQTSAIFGLLLLIPALIVFIILLVLRLRRGKFHRQRIARRSRRSKTQDDGTENEPRR
jgi:flagellar biogenesis protein FliO